MANATGHGGARENSGGARPGAGRPPGKTGNDVGRIRGATDVQLNPARIVSRAHKWGLAELAVQYAEEAFLGLVHLMRHAQSEVVRLAAMDKILDRTYGKAPQHVDIAAIKHTEIVYRSAEEIRQELLARGVPQVLLDYTPPAPEPSADSDKP